MRERLRPGCIHKKALAEAAEPLVDYDQASPYQSYRNETRRRDAAETGATLDRAEASPELANRRVPKRAKLALSAPRWTRRTPYGGPHGLDYSSTRCLRVGRAVCSICDSRIQFCADKDGDGSRTSTIYVRRRGEWRQSRMRPSAPSTRPTQRTTAEAMWGLGAEPVFGSCTGPGGRVPWWRLVDDGVGGGALGCSGGGYGGG